ncbi:hypothetical protein AB0D29_10385 [Streptomyces sp. NPDC048424]|uniref:hypothetical protein n=1 Tax=Streptomyces sp. NPDC048424 TaxID=3155265 RepID=UPI003427AEC7
MKNMPEAGDFSYEAIQKPGNPVPMLVTNDGDELLECPMPSFAPSLAGLPRDHAPTAEHLATQPS